MGAGGGRACKRLDGIPIGVHVFPAQQDAFNPTSGPDAGSTRKRKYVDKCYTLYSAHSTWSRAPYSVMEQISSNGTGPPECRKYFSGTWDDAGRSDYDFYNICRGRAFWSHDELIDPLSHETYATSNRNLTDPLFLAFTWQDARSNGLPGFSRKLKYATYDGSGCVGTLLSTQRVLLILCLPIFLRRFVFDLVNLTTRKLVDSVTFLRENTWLDRQVRKDVELSFKF